MQQLAYGSVNYNTQQNASYYDQGGSYPLPSLSPQGQYHNNFIAQQGPGIQPSYSPQRWSQGSFFFPIILALVDRSPYRSTSVQY